MDNIIIEDAWEGNLKHISLKLQKNKFNVLCGLSGSGKSTLAVDVIFQECQRQYLEALGMEGIMKPKVERITNGSVAVLISQNEKNNHNPRSYVGTTTDLYTDLRMIFEKLGKYPCPHCHTILHPYECKEELIKHGSDYQVFQTCTHCGFRMEKLTRSHFSYNTREGACPTCDGFGEVLEIDDSKVMQNSLSLEAGAIDFWVQKYKEYQIDLVYKAFTHYDIPYLTHTAICDFTPVQKTILLYGTSSDQVKAVFPNITPPKNTSQGKFEGIYPMLWRKVEEKGANHDRIAAYFHHQPCPTCHGERLQSNSRQVTVLGKRIGEVNAFTIEDLLDWMKQLQAQLASKELEQIDVYLQDIMTKCRRITSVGLAYLSLDRRMSTLSGGECQRLKLAAALDCELNGLLYILDEPTIGLHPKDTLGLLEVLHDLQAKGNTLLIIEHDPLVLQHAQHIVEIGPLAGAYGGEIIFTGTYPQLQKANTPTGRWLSQSTQPHSPRSLQPANIQISNANLHNLKNVSLSIPSNGIICFCGVSGSGKSTLVFDLIGKQDPCVLGCEQYQSIKQIDQNVIHRSIRSNVATYCGVYTYIRTLFGKQPLAKANGFDAKSFSFNSKGGRCERCEGLGTITSNRLFFQDILVPCPVCHGGRFQEEVLSIKYKDYSISDILQMEIGMAFTIFEQENIKSMLQVLIDCGLGYITLGQDLTTLSGGEAQRLKFAKELLSETQSNTLYLLDEPTVGLHPQDVEQFLVLLKRLVQQGNTIFIVEHNTQVMRASDYLIELGEGGGIHGGNIIAMGTLAEIKKEKGSITKAFL